MAPEGQRTRRRDAPAGAVLWQAEPDSPADLSLQRPRVRDLVLADGPGLEDVVDRLLLILEELGVNALRHGRPPVQARLSNAGSHWLVEVSDAAPHVVPVPAVHPLAADGGLGLRLAATLADAWGWEMGDTRKTVWARFDRPTGTTVLG
jgi:two-component sensor histidine kinase